MIPGRPPPLLLLRSCHNSWVNVTQQSSRAPEFIQTDVDHMLCQARPDLRDKGWLTPCLHNLIQTHGGQPSLQPSLHSTLQSAGRHDKHRRSQCEGLAVRGVWGATNCPGGEREREMFYIHLSSAQLCSTLEFSQSDWREDFYPSTLNMDLWLQ